MEDIVSQTKAEYQRTRERLALLLSKTPEDKLNWAPSTTSRTAVELVAHSAESVGHILSMLKGQQDFEFNGTSDMDNRLRTSEKQYATREAAIAILDKNSAELLSFLDGLTPEALGGTVKAFFGEAPMAMAMNFPRLHMQDHVAQLEYLQTIWGDVDWYSPNLPK
jgi:hypothetical protein